jgi:hypothetical protein
MYRSCVGSDAPLENRKKCTGYDLCIMKIEPRYNKEANRLFNVIAIASNTTSQKICRGTPAPLEQHLYPVSLTGALQTQMIQNTSD